MKVFIEGFKAAAKWFSVRSCFVSIAVGVIVLTILWYNAVSRETSVNSKTNERLKLSRGNVQKIGSIPIITDKPLASHKEYDQVKSLVLFIGYPRSGHTIVRTLIDAHPNAIIANEIDVISRWKNWEPKNRNKYFLFDHLYKISRMQAKKDYRSKRGHQLFKYLVPGQFQGRVQGTLKVIGAKHGGKTANLLKDNAGSQLLKSIMKTVRVPLKFLHVVRNPYDNIATMLLRTKNLRLSLTDEFQLNDTEALNREIGEYFYLAYRNQYLAKTFGKSLLEIQSIELIRRPKEILKKICKFLDLTCTPKYLVDCAKIIYKDPSQTRHNVVWTNEQKRRIKKTMKRFAFLKRFTFESD